MRLFRALTLLGAVACTAIGCSGGPSGPRTLKYDLPELLGRHAGSHHVVGRFATKAYAGSATVVSARISLAGTAIVGQQACCFTTVDTVPFPYMLSFFLSGAGREQKWMAHAELTGAGEFVADAEFRGGYPDSILTHIGASMDSLMVVGSPLMAVSCSPFGPEPEVTITRAELVLEVE